MSLELVEREVEVGAGPRRRRSRAVLVVAVAAGLVLLGLGGVLAVRIGQPAQYTGTALLGKPVPDLTLPSLEGDRVSLRALAGRAVVVNFFNSWCVPCREELPALRAFHARHRGDPEVALVGIVRDDDERAVRDYVRDEGIGWTVLLDPDGRASVDFATTGQPETYAVSPDGTIVGRHLGRATVGDLERLLALARGEER